MKSVSVSFFGGTVLYFFNGSCWTEDIIPDLPACPAKSWGRAKEEGARELDSIFLAFHVSFFEGSLKLSKLRSMARTALENLELAFLYQKWFTCSALTSNPFCIYKLKVDFQSQRHLLRYADFWISKCCAEICERKRTYDSVIWLNFFSKPWTGLKHLRFEFKSSWSSTSSMVYSRICLWGESRVFIIFWMSSWF